MSKTLDFLIDPEHMASRFNIEKPIFEGQDKFGDWHSPLHVLKIKIPVDTRGNPIVEVRIMVEVPEYVKEELQQIAEGMVIRHMIAESLCPDRPTSID